MSKKVESQAGSGRKTSFADHCAVVRVTFFLPFTPCYAEVTYIVSLHAKKAGGVLTHPSATPTKRTCLRQGTDCVVVDLTYRAPVSMLCGWVAEVVLA